MELAHQSNNMDKFQKNYAEWTKADKKKYVLHNFIYIKF